MTQIHAKQLATDFPLQANIRCKVQIVKIGAKYMQNSLQQIFACERISVARFGWPKYAPKSCKTACNRFSLASGYPLQFSDGQHLMEIHEKQPATDFCLQVNIRCKVRMANIVTKYMQNSLQHIFACKRMSIARFRWLKYDPNTCKAACNRFSLASEYPLQGSDIPGGVKVDSITKFRNYVQKTRN